MRNALQIASLAVRALEQGGLTLVGSTGTVLKRSIATMRSLVHASVDEVRGAPRSVSSRTVFSLNALLDEALAGATLEADAKGCTLSFAPVDPALRIDADRDAVLAALANLLANAVKFTRPHSRVSLGARSVDGVTVIDVADQCGGLPPRFADTLFQPFRQLGEDRSGLGLGLSIAKHNVEASGGHLTVADVPGAGCVFSIHLPDRAALRAV